MGRTPRTRTATQPSKSKKEMQDGARSTPAVGGGVSRRSRGKERQKGTTAGCGTAGVLVQKEGARKLATGADTRQKGSAMPRSKPGVV